MITGEIKTKIDNIWDAFWTGGITNSITVLEQMTVSIRGNTHCDSCSYVRPLHQQ